MNCKSLTIASLLAATLAGGCAKNPADEVPAAQVNTPGPVAAATTAPTDMTTPAATATVAATPGESGTPVVGTTFAFAPGAEVGWVGSKVTGSHNGGFKSVQGKVIVPEAGIEGASVELVVDTTSIYSDDEKLTEHLKSDDFFAVNQFPTATFKSTSVKKTDAGYEVTGDLNLHGVTKSITFPAKIEVEGDGLKTAAEFAIDRKDFGIVYAGKPDDLIRDEVVLKYDINATKEG